MWAKYHKLQTLSRTSRERNTSSLRPIHMARGWSVQNTSSQEAQAGRSKYPGYDREGRDCSPNTKTTPRDREVAHLNKGPMAGNWLDTRPKTAHEQYVRTKNKLINQNQNCQIN